MPTFLRFKGSLKVLVVYHMTANYYLVRLYGQENRSKFYVHKTQVTEF